MDALAQSYTPEQINIYKTLLKMFKEPPKIFIFYTPPTIEYSEERRPSIELENVRDVRGRSLSC